MTMPKKQPKNHLQHAGRNSLNQMAKAKDISTHTTAKYITMYYRFTEFLEDEYGIKKARHITRDHHLAYLNYKFNQGCSRATVKNISSVLNKTLPSITGTKEANIRSFQAEFPLTEHSQFVDRAIPQHVIDEIHPRATPLLQALLLPLCNAGFRIRESLLQDYPDLTAQLKDADQITIVRGTKGGRKRSIQLLDNANADGIFSLAEHLQPLSLKTLIPRDMKLSTLESRLRQELNTLLQPYKDIGTLSQNIAFHGFRHRYARDLYHQVTGVLSKTDAGFNNVRDHIKFIAGNLDISIQEAKDLDHNARKTVSASLGHDRLRVTNGYL